MFVGDVGGGGGDVVVCVSCCNFGWLCSVLWLFVIAVGVGDGGGVLMSLFVFVVWGLLLVFVATPTCDC